MSKARKSRAKKSAVTDAIAADKAFAVRTSLMGFVFVALLSLLSWRLITVQYIQCEKYRRIVENQHIDGEVLPARRGQIYDRHNEVLVANKVEETLYVDRIQINDLRAVCVPALAHAEGVEAADIWRSYSPEEIRQKYIERLGALLAEPLGMQHWEVIRKITQSKKVEIILAKKIDESAAARMKAILQAEHMVGTTDRIVGVKFRSDFRRSYTSINRLTHVLGYMAESGNAGIESSMNKYLEGVDGFRLYETDARGREIAGFRHEAIEPRHGNHVRLTVDMGLQEIVENTLDEIGNDPNEIYAPKLRAEKISVVLLEPGTGAVLAAANRPHFDLETRRGDWRNFAVCGQYEPGSTFKIVALSGALDSGRVYPNQRIPISPNGVLKEKGIPRLKDDHIYRELTVEGILVKSSNIGAYKLARQLGRQRFYDMARKFGFGEKPGLGLPGESKGQVHSPSGKSWSKPTLSRMAMGYEVAVTPMQMATALSVIVNDGLLLKPRIVDAIFDDRGVVVETRRPTVARRAISAKTASAMRKALTKVCLKGGTGTRAAPDGYPVAGKTGTTQRYDTVRKRYMKGRYVVSFIGFVPADDPKLIAVVVVDDPRISNVKLYGGTIAAPIFRRIARRSMAYLKVEPSESSSRELATSIPQPRSAH